MNNNIRFELSFKNISQLENKLNFCKLNNIKNINIPCKGVIKKDLFNSTIKYISKNYIEVDVSIVECPDLRKWDCPAEGISGNQRIIDVGGEPYMHDKRFIGTEFDYEEIAKKIGSE